MNCVILQPSYIPWRGYFHQIYKADCFVFYDDVQYDKNGWRNRNRIKTRTGPVWLTIPVLHRGSVSERIPIMDMRIDWSKDWSRKHWSSIQQSYSKAPYFNLYAELLEGFFRQKPDFLADFTIDLTMAIARSLGIERTRFVRSSKLGGSGVKTDRLVDILCKLGATHYISGPAARDYLEEDKLAHAAISVEYMAYDYPEYRQLYPPFDAQISILDLLFMTGPNAGKFIWGADV
jgi:hypothetical protein